MIDFDYLEKEKNYHTLYLFDTESTTPPISNLILHYSLPNKIKKVILVF